MIEDSSYHIFVDNIIDRALVSLYTGVPCTTSGCILLEVLMCVSEISEIASAVGSVAGRA